MYIRGGNIGTKKKIIVIFICVLLVVSILPVTGTIITNDRPSLSSYDCKTLYVGGSGPGNYSRILDAIDAAVDCDTVYVYDDSSPYYENIIIDKSINLIGEDRATTIIDGNKIADVVHISADGVNISGFTIQKGWSDWIGLTYVGIDINSSLNTIYNNIILTNENGINLEYPGDYNIIIGNVISNNKRGINLINSKDNTIIKNNFIDNNRDAFFTFSCYFHILDEDLSKMRNIWSQNYWNRPRILPKFIIGEIWWTSLLSKILRQDVDLHLPWFNLDLHPTLEPYDF